MATLEEMQAELAEIEALEAELASLESQSAANSHFNKAMDFTNPQDPSYGPIGAPTQPQQAQTAIDILSSPEGAGSPEKRDMLLSQYHDYSDPIDAANSAEAAKKLGTTALEVGGGALATYLAPQIGVPKVIGQAAPFVTRGANYAINAFAGALGQEAGSQVAQQTGMAPKKTMEESVDSVATNTAIGGGIPLAADMTGQAIKSAAGWFSKTLLNTPGRVASFLGASKVDTNPEAEKYIGDKTEELMSNSSFFNEQIVKSSDPVKQYNAADAYLKQTGKTIGDFYATHAPVPLPTDYIWKHPKIIRLQEIITDPTSSSKMREEAQVALDGLGFFSGKKAVALEDSWKVRGNLDKSIQGAIYNKGVGQTPALAEYIQDTANVVREAMEQSIKGGVNTGTITADAAETLLKAKQEYSNLSPIKKLLGGEFSEAKRVTLIDKLPTNLQQMGAAGLVAYNPAIGLPVAAAMGLKSNAGRAFGARLPGYAQGMSDLASVASPYIGAGSSLFPRTTDTTKLNVSQLSNAVFERVAMMAGPEQAQALALDVENSMSSGNAEVKKQTIAFLSQQFPDLFEPNPEGLSGIVDNKFINPMEKDVYVKEKLDKSATERALSIGPSFQNKYTPPSAAPMQSLAQPSPQIDLPSLSSGMDEAFASPAPQQSSDLTSMLNQLTNAEAEHFANDYGIIQ